MRQEWRFIAPDSTEFKSKQECLDYEQLLESTSYLDNYIERPGLEGPFNFSGRIVYYDKKEGKHWDPRTDFYLSHGESLKLYFPN